MKLTCTYSGLEFQVQYFGGMRNFPSVHPIFELSTKSLLSRTADFYKQETTKEEKRLLFLALLNSSGLIEWRCQAGPDDKIILQNFEHLSKTVSWLEFFSYDTKLSRRIGPAFPKFVISPETKKLDNIRYWLQCWEDARVEYEKGSRRESVTQRIFRRERALTKLINDPSKEPEKFSWLLAQWAADAAEFPENIQVRLGGASETITLREYWIQILTEKNPYEIREVDLEELEEHLVDHLEHGSIYAFNVLELVRGKLKRQKASLGLGDIFSPDELAKINASPFTIVTETIEQENILAAARDAPEKEPARNNYSSNLAYLRDKAHWILAQKVKLSEPSEAMVTKETETEVETEKESSNDNL